MENRKGFTLVELLAVIVVLGIILLIAVPQISKTIDESKKGIFASSAKTIAANAENMYLAHNTMGKKFEVTCDKVAEMSKDDYEKCEITMSQDGKATVYLKGAGRFEGKYICAGTREEAIVSETECETPSGGGGRLWGIWR